MGVDDIWRANYEISGLGEFRAEAVGCGGIISLNPWMWMRIDVRRFGFFLQMGFTLILATLDGLDVGLLGDVIGGDDCDDDE
ncbi:hypothetical protein Tco_0842458 [Tanacetum coccineum]|uniref:Uncharacterized protein n=1 Tax=Tanacetum coccineum TaxID=301880 RepID=A0ABQ5B3H2_9ASTR